ncbi:glycosyltransferase family 2 protein [Chryseobacterium gotjawalense]|uniref:Glycosyltransferase family 2 protein n=1 Tax=Chryseobacterium gotjawalense TaxID=3042315 RepID=A0ABY8RCL4_9FLAO|nr:glycosyltransferase family 2 protein [Chryseobacterium sp. wdc7]WHF51439.1 glycosyltransferase family 2 protein [Chryseobacterium sp. wdc7]
MSPKISVIIPVFNGQKTILNTIKNVLSQTFTDFELIIVNDKSTDRTLDILTKVASHDKRIRIIDKQKNEKPFIGRIDGVRIAKAEWVTFVDADDYFYPNALQKLYEQTAKQPHVILGSYCKVYDRLGWSRSKPINVVPKECLEGEFIFVKSKFRLAFWGCHSIFVSSCAKLYHMSLFNDIKAINFKAIHSFDDTLLNLLLFEMVNKIVFIKDPIIDYRYGGGTSKFNKLVLPDLDVLYQYRSSLLDKCSDSEKENYSNLEYINTIYSYFLNGLIIERWSSDEFNIELENKKVLPVFKHCIEISTKYNLTSATFFLNLRNKELCYKHISTEANRLRFKRLIYRSIGAFLAKL